MKDWKGWLLVMRKMKRKMFDNRMSYWMNFSQNLMCLLENCRRNVLLQLINRKRRFDTVRKVQEKNEKRGEDRTEEGGVKEKVF